MVRECLLQGRGGVSPDSLPPRAPRWGILWMGEVGGLRCTGGSWWVDTRWGMVETCGLVGRKFAWLGVEVGTVVPVVLVGVDWLGY